ncbi:UNVERIFIED_CONTAM: Serine/threonine-protein kinase RIO1 [Siphonaria sp. JEL0065]|nr:Serine/threonine-protein kinase RIO1 [Siphonaria sp. JEL0065]
MNIDSSNCDAGRFSDADDEGGLSSVEVLSAKRQRNLNGSALNAKINNSHNNTTATTSTTRSASPADHPTPHYHHSHEAPPLPHPHSHTHPVHAATSSTPTIITPAATASGKKKAVLVATASVASSLHTATESGADADEEDFTNSMDEFWNEDVDDAQMDNDDGSFDSFDDDSLDDDDPQLALEHNDQWHAATGDFTKQFNKMRANVSSNSANNTAAKKIITKQKVASKPADADAALDELSAKFASKIRIDPLVYENKLNTASVQGDMRVYSRKAEGDKTTNKDKADRATVEQVLDPRTRIILFKLLNNQTLSQVNGCISTGKEANVYHATTPDGQHRAIKVYKTSILVFKDRDRYVTGEFRYRNGYAKSNPRKMVKMWAEKEMRNLKRLVVAGIPCPEPLLLRMHVLVMGFLGDKNGWASPRLKDAVINDSMTYKNLYIHLLKMVWKMYHKYHNKTLFLIDVSQSVEHDHPHALEFLRKDLQNICDYFKKRVPPPSEEYADSVNIFTLRELFDYTVTPWDAILKTVREKGLLLVPTGDCVAEVDEDAVLDAYTMYMHSPEARLNIQEVAASKGVSVAAAQAEVDIQEAVFKQAYIPRTLQEIVDYERDVDKAQKGQVEVNSGVGVYGRVTGLVIEEKIGASGVSKEIAAAVAVSGSMGVAAAVGGGKKSGAGNASSSSATTATPTATAKDGPFSEENDEESEEDDDDSDDDSDDDGEDGEGSDFDDDRKKESRLKKDEEKDSKKARKQAVKEEKREKRKAKMPKAVKKRKQKVSAASKK